MERLGNSIPRLCAQLSAEAASRGEKSWKLVPKRHTFQHVALYHSKTCGNPRMYWTYADEDMVGQMIEVAESCHPTTMANAAMFKWILLRFAD